MARPVAVVTGAAQGIGLEAARRLAATHDVALLDLDGDGARAAAAAHRGRALGVGVRHHRPRRARSAAANAVLEAFGGVDVVVANAGVALTGALRHVDPAVVEAQVRVNLTGSWRSIHAFLPQVVERRGYILGVASVSALAQAPGIGAYAASKAGFEALLRTLRQEVAHLGVDVGIAYFHWIDTDMVRGAERESPEFAEMRARDARAGRPDAPRVRGRRRRSPAASPLARRARRRAPLGRRSSTGCAASSLRWPTAGRRGRRAGRPHDRRAGPRAGPVAGAMRRDHAPSEAAARAVERRP